MKMILGLFLRNYKIYEGINFIPVTTGNYFSAYFGMNGVGKSSVLEALDSFFNSAEFIINNNKSTGYMNDSYVVPIFLIKKSDFANVKDENFKLLEKISDFYWNVETFTPLTTEKNEFLEFKKFVKETLGDAFKDYLFFAMGVRNNEFRNPCFGPFQHEEDLLKVFEITKSKKENQTDRAKDDDDAIKKFFTRKKTLDYIREQYHYIYIPADIDIKAYTKLETDDMQKLMNKNVSNEITAAIGDVKLDQINDSLDAFIQNISEKLGNYTYKPDSEKKGKVTMELLSSKIIQSYFATRILAKTDTDVSISTMSSGEKHKALIDVCYAFLEEESQHNRKIILAIDEPEISLHVSACYEQFEKLKEISSKKHQVIITTHWYGFLPIISDGIAHNIVIPENAKKENKREIVSYNLGKYREEIRHNTEQQHALPDDVYLKSKYDLVQSIISAMRADKNYNYILVEGSSDKIYLENYLSFFIKNNNLRIMPLGGCGEIKSIMNLLTATAEDKNIDISGKILAIIDTDEKIMRVDSKVDNKRFFFKRILYDSKAKDIVLVDVASDSVSPPTEIEDVLEPAIFLKMLKKFTQNDKNYSFLNSSDDEATCSYKAVDYTESQREKVKEFFSEGNHKVEFAEQYVKENLDPSKLAFIKSICEIFKWEIPIIDKQIDKIKNEISGNSPEDVKPRKKVIVVKKKVASGENVK